MKLKGVYAFRVTRNFDLEIDEEEADDLLQTIQQELRRRERGAAVRLEVAGEPSTDSLAKLVRALKLEPERDVYRTPFLNVAELLGVVPREERRDLREEPFSPLLVPPLRDVDDIFAAIRENDILLHHPFESFDPVVELITRAAEDPDVLAIKQTLYRAGGDSPIVKALARRGDRQAGHRHRRDQGALRRGVEHPVGAHARAERRARRVRPPRPEDAREVLPHHPP